MQTIYLGLNNEKKDLHLFDKFMQFKEFKTGRQISSKCVKKIGENSSLELSSDRDRRLKGTLDWSLVYIGE